MPRHSAPKSHAEPHGGEGVIRATKSIPTLAPVAPPASEAVETGVCSGRCGHCNLHPCRLHTSV